MAKLFKRLLITGAAGGLGKVLRARLKDYADILRLSDINSLGEAATNEEIIQCDLSDYNAVFNMVKDVDAILHFGGISVESDFKSILHANIEGSYNIYEAARKQGVKRIIYASSNHTIGFYDTTQTLDASVRPRPDSLYGVSKCFVEDLSSYYYDKFGIETVNIRIGSCYPEPNDRRMLATWLSYDDFIQLIDRSLNTPRVGFMIVYGVSNNNQQYWDNHLAATLGYKPKDNAENYREKLQVSTQPLSPDSPLARYQGGLFATTKPTDN